MWYSIVLYTFFLVFEFHNFKRLLLSLSGDLDASERQIRTRIADVFERLRDIGGARNGLKNFK